MLNPNNIREIAVLTHESIVRSNARRVRSTASLVAGLALVESPPARSVTETDPMVPDRGLCAHAKTASSPPARRRKLETDKGGWRSAKPWRASLARVMRRELWPPKAAYQRTTQASNAAQ